jgi:hypothetical protein
MSVFYFDVRENGRLIVDSASVELLGVSEAVDCAKSYVRRVESPLKTVGDVRHRARRCRPGNLDRLD